MRGSKGRKMAVFGVFFNMKVLGDEDGARYRARTCDLYRMKEAAKILKAIEIQLSMKKQKKLSGTFRAL